MMEAVNVVRPCGSLYRTAISAGRPSSSSSFASNRVDFAPCFQSPFKNLVLTSYRKQEHRRVGLGSRRCVRVRASSQSSESAASSAPIAPLQLESPVGQFLSQILINHPHLVPAAVDQQLEQLQADRNADEHKEDPSVSGTDLVLYRRIAEVKANERRKTLEEILYALVVKKFMDADVSLVPSVASSSTDPSDPVDTWPEQDEKLKQLHSAEAYEMVQNHLALILGNRADDPTTIAEINKLRVGQVYAASVMYGYFLKRADQRFQLEKAIETLPNSADVRGSNVREVAWQDIKSGSGDTAFRAGSPHPEMAWSGETSPGGFGHGTKDSKLRSYVMSFDGETLKRYATIRSKESINIIEKHTEALFGRPDITLSPQRPLDSSKEELINISFGGLQSLVLEAVTFGSFLWDVESHVDSTYHFAAK